MAVGGDFLGVVEVPPGGVPAWGSRRGWGGRRRVVGRRRGGHGPRGLNCGSGIGCWWDVGRGWRGDGGRGRRSRSLTSIRKRRDWVRDDSGGMGGLGARLVEMFGLRGGLGNLSLTGLKTGHYRRSLGW